MPLLKYKPLCPSYSSEAANAIIARDDEIDSLFDQVNRELLTYMLVDPKTIDRATQLISVARNLERVGDRVENICERVIYAVTGDVAATPVAG